MAIKRTVFSKPILNKQATILLFIVAAILALMLFVALKYYNRIFGPNVSDKAGKGIELFIPSNPSFDEVLGLLKFSGAIDNINDFVWLARHKGYPAKPIGGRYILRDGMSNNELVNILRAGAQSPINLTFNNIRKPEELAGLLSRRLEADSLSFVSALRDEELLAELGFEPHTVAAMLLPNTYQMFWNISPEGFVKRMHREYESFWNNERKQKAEDLRLSPIQVATLASIVDEETVRGDEKSRVAGLYLNRLDIGMRLQADPTIKFVIGDFSVNRILSKDLEVDSPYNTYIYAGLPPGPIRIPSISGIDAVLDRETHDYLYMCAKDDFSGYHAFAKTLRQHNVNAEKYRRALNRNRIYR